MGADEVLCI